MQYRDILKKYWGYDDFRGVQREIIESIGCGRDTLGLMPTGGGKSITFQVPALAGDGLCIVVTPLIALMKDQVANLRCRGIKAVAVYSGMRTSEVVTALENCIFGDSEVTHLIPNQIAINRMLSASVWASMYMGMPIMTVNGDTVTEDITNDPGQIIRVYGTNEDVAGAVHYVSPPDFSSGFNAGVSSLIQNTLEGSGAGMTALGKIGYNNTAAIQSIANVSGVSAASLKVRYLSFLGEIALTFVDFWMNKYGKRPLLIDDKNGRWYFPFDSDRYQGMRFYVETNFKEEKSI